MIVAPRFPARLLHLIVSGLAYGVLLWIIMYWIVRPLRFPEIPLPHTLYGIANQLFSHCILVGIPIALIAARHFQSQARKAGDHARSAARRVGKACVSTCSSRWLPSH